MPLIRKPVRSFIPVNDDGAIRMTDLKGREVGDRLTGSLSCTRQKTQLQKIATIQRQFSNVHLLNECSELV